MQLLMSRITTITEPMLLTMIRVSTRCSPRIVVSSAWPQPLLQKVSPTDPEHGLNGPRGPRLPRCCVYKDFIFVLIIFSRCPYFSPIHDFYIPNFLTTDQTIDICVFHRCFISVHWESISPVLISHALVSLWGYPPIIENLTQASKPCPELGHTTPGNALWTASS